LTKIYTSNVCEWVADRFMREYNKKAAKNREICLMHLLPANTTPKTRSMPEEVIYEDVT